MTATKRSPNCSDCDCCIIYESDFCNQLKKSGANLTYFGGEWYPDSGAVEKNWKITSTDGGCSAVSCDAETPFAFGVYDESHLRDRIAILEQQLPISYHAFIDFELFYDSSLDDDDYKIGLEIYYDFAGTNRYNSIRVRLDYSDAGGDLYIVFDFIKNQLGEETLLGSLKQQVGSTGTTSCRAMLEVAIQECTNCDDDGTFQNDYLLCVKSDYAADGSRDYYASDLIPITLVYPDLDFTKFGIATQNTVYAGSESFDCSGVTTEISKHARVYSVELRQNQLNRAGCERCAHHCCCCGNPLEIDVTFSGFSNTDCGLCSDELNNTYTLLHYNGILGASVNCGFWRYDFDEYSLPRCEVDDLELKLRYIQLTLNDLVWNLQLGILISRESPHGDLPVLGDCSFNWQYTDSNAADPPLIFPACLLNGTETFSYVTNNADNERCYDFVSGSAVYYNLSDFCSMGTVTVENA